MQVANYLMMQAFAKSFSFHGKRILEVGAFVVPGHERSMRLRELFVGAAEYIGMDMREGVGVDKVENVQALSFPDHTFDLIISLDTFEHVEDPIQAIKEIHRVTKPDGVLVLSSVMNFPIHDFPSDYWRFTPECFRSLTKNYATQYIGYYGNKSHPQNVYAICCNGSSAAFDRNMSRFMKEWKTMTPRSLLEAVVHSARNILRDSLRFVNITNVHLRKAD